jgi:hypothetical protein
VLIEKKMLTDEELFEQLNKLPRIFNNDNQELNDFKKKSEDSSKENKCDNIKEVNENNKINENNNKNDFNNKNENNIKFHIEKNEFILPENIKKRKFTQNKEISPNKILKKE